MASLNRNIKMSTSGIGIKAISSSVRILIIIVKQVLACYYVLVETENVTMDVELHLMK